jgi:excisionase family DNA binding protein
MSASTTPTHVLRKPGVRGAPVTQQHTASQPALMSVPEAAKFLGLSRASAYRYAEAGLLPTKRFGRRVYVVRARLNEFLESDDTAQVDVA